MSSTSTIYLELLEEYQSALETWAAAEVIYAPDGPELIAAARQLEEIENALDVFQRPLAA